MLSFGRSSLLAVVLVASTLPAFAGWSEHTSRQVDALVRTFLASAEVAPEGLSLSIAVDGHLEMAKGYGDAGPGRPADAETVYHVGSLTKQFTAAAMLKLIEAGTIAPRSGHPLSLDTPLREIFEGVDGWTGTDAAPVSVRALLTMTSNLPNFTRRPPPEADPWGAVETPQLLAALKRQSPRGWPNTFEYSNTGYFLIAQVIDTVLAARAQGPRTMREYVREMLLLPAGMHHTGFVGERSPHVALAMGHYRRRPAFTHPHWLDGSGDMASSATDIFLWNKALMEGRLLSPASREAMFSDAARVDPLTYYGMGWFVAHDGALDSYHHSGSVPGYTAYNAIVRERTSARWISVTLLANSDGVEGLGQLADDIFLAVRSVHEAR